MNSSTVNVDVFDQVESVFQQQGAEKALEALISTLHEQKNWHNLFDARMLQKKAAMGLPLNKPTSLSDVPEEHRVEAEKAYAAAAREAGEGFLSQGNIPEAWMYLQVIREPEKVAAALEALPDQIEDPDELEQILQIALFQGVNPTKGVRLMLNSHGTCSTITALDQTIPQFTAEQRAACAKEIVRHLHHDLSASVHRNVVRQEPDLPEGLGLRELMEGREWIFQGGNYHIDISHLGSAVRFSRSIEAGAPELELAIDLATYGSQLDSMLQYPGEPPFNDFYGAHLHFFNIVQKRQLEEGLDYFRELLKKETDIRDQPLLAYALVDLLVRSDKLDEAVEVAAQYLTNLGEEVNQSFEELCEKAKRWDVLKQVRRDQQAVVAFAAALIREKLTASD